MSPLIARDFGKSSNAGCAKAVTRKCFALCKMKRKKNGGWACDMNVMHFLDFSMGEGREGHPMLTFVEVKGSVYVRSVA